jgi:uncharacterized protein (TIGR02145 family)
MPHTLFISLTAFLLFIACDDKLKTQAVSSGSKDTVAVIAMDSLFKKDKDDIENGVEIEIIAEKTNASVSTFVDPRDSKAYKIVKIGKQTWMAENLNYEVGESWCVHLNDSYCYIYGRTYDWKTAKDACPRGWHLSSREEWNNLIKATGDEKFAHEKLKSEKGWDGRGAGGDDFGADECSNGTDEFGFSALPGGYYNDGGYYDVDDTGNWWSSTESDGDNAYYFSIFCNKEGVDEDNGPKRLGFYIRCVED